MAQLLEKSRCSVLNFLGTAILLTENIRLFIYGDRNGDVVIISMVGKDHENNVEIKAMLDSIKFK